MAAQDPGRDFLVISADKTGGSAGEYLEVMRSLANAHRWAAIVDVSGLEINWDEWLTPDRGLSRFRRYAAMRDSFETLGRAVTEYVSPDAVDELFVTCLDHPDVQLLAQLMPRADVCYLPHGLGSIHGAENSACVRQTAKRSLPRRSCRLVVSSIKRPIWGVAATPPLPFEIAEGLSLIALPRLTITPRPSAPHNP